MLSDGLVDLEPNLQENPLGKGARKKGGWPGLLICLCFFGNHFFVLKTSKHAMKHMISLFKKKVDVLSDNFLMLWFKKDSLDTVGFRTFSTFRGGVQEP